MTDSLVQGLTAALGGKVSGEIIIFIISMIPILELRGGLLAASPALLNVPILRAIPICIIGNLLPIPFILLLIEKVLDLMEKIPGLCKIARWVRQKADKNKGQIEKFGFWGLALFVGNSSSRNRRMDWFPGCRSAPYGNLARLSLLFLLESKATIIMSLLSYGFRSPLR